MRGPGGYNLLNQIAETSPVRVAGWLPAALLATALWAVLLWLVL